MARGDQMARQWRIVQLLNNSRVGKTVHELEAELDCHKRTVYRDPKALERAGFPIYDEQGEDGVNRWLMLESFGKSMAVPLNLTEVMALYFGRDMLKVLKGTVFHEAIGSVFEKIRVSLPEETGEYLKKLEGHLQFGQRPYKKYAEVKDLISILNEAIDNRTCLDIIYYAMYRNREKKRCVAPYKIWFSDGSFYMIGYCHFRKDVRIFALDRIKIHHITDQHFDIPDDFNADALMKDSFGVFLGPPTDVKICFDKSIACYIRERVWHHSQKITDRKDGSIIFSAKVAGLDEVCFWVMQWWAHAKALSPPELVRRIRKEAFAMHQAHLDTKIEDKGRPEQMPMFPG